MKIKEALGVAIVFASLFGLAAILYNAARPETGEKKFKPVLPKGIIVALEGQARITSTRHGSMDWTMTCEGLAYHYSSNLVTVASPGVWIPMADGGTVQVNGREGVYFTDSEDIAINDDVGISMNRGGKNEWVLSGDTASYQKDEQKMLIHAFQGTINTEAGETVEITAGRGTYDMTGRSMLLEQDVDCIWSRGTRLKTDALTYDIAANTAVTDQEVLITGEGFTLRGIGFSADMGSRNIVVKKNVSLNMKKGMRGLQ